MNKSEKQFVQSVCQILDRSLQEVDDKTESRLDAVRKAALAQTRTSDPSWDESLMIDTVLSTLEDQPQPDFVNKRLDVIRNQALGRLGSSASKAEPGRWQAWVAQFFGGGFPLSASMAATACILLTVVSLVAINNNSGGNLSLDDELVLVASADDLELYENLDFYLWLDENGFAN